MGPHPPRRFFLSNFKNFERAFTPMKILSRLLTLLFISSTLSHAQVTQLLDHDGYLMEKKKPANGVRTMEVRLYDAAVKGKLLYSEKIGKVSVSDGEFYFQYGSKGIASALQGNSHWLEIVVNGKAHSPRERLVAVPFAILSADAQALVPQVSSLSGNMTTLKSQNTALSSNVASVSSNLTTAQATIVTMAEEMQALRADLVAAGVLSGGGGNMITGNMITVQGGTLPQSSELAGQTVATFQIGKYEVTMAEWQEVRAWAVENGYSDLADVGAGSAGGNPVRDVSWYDVLKWSNAKSQKSGFSPVYQVGGVVYKTGLSVPTVNSSANGYRLPLEKEWEWAARGGVDSQGYLYSGTSKYDSADSESELYEYAWFAENSDESQIVGTRKANELGIHDMSGNVKELVYDSISKKVDGYSVLYPRVRGGSFKTYADSLTVAKRGVSNNPVYSVADDLGFRLARSSGN